jgi:hypothetical protein
MAPLRYILRAQTPFNSRRTEPRRGVASKEGRGGREKHETVRKRKREREKERKKERDRE